MSMTTRSYSEMMKLRTFEERYKYLKLNGIVAEDTFGSRRYLNQQFYRSKEWLSFRDKIIVRDNGCDLGIEDRELYSNIIIHHINPISIDDVVNRRLDVLLNPDNAICVSKTTHDAIHYGDENLLVTEPIERKANDTCPWKR